jgi:hypothetical protein
MMKMNFFYALCLFTGLGCSNQRAEEEAQAEAARVRSAIAGELHAGSSEAEIKLFGDRHSWHFSFDEDQARFRANVYTTPENTHDVLVFLYVNGKRELVRSEVKIARTSL